MQNRNINQEALYHTALKEVPMKIFVTGIRGIPDIPGGIEKHCQELFPRIAARGHDVFLSTRHSYVTEKLDEWRSVKLICCLAPRKKCFEAIVHTFIALVKARCKNPDIVHIHGIGPSLLTPLARLMGLRVVVTNHGPDYHRQKWGRTAKFMLRLGERMGGLWADQVIVISSVIRDIIRDKCRRESNLIHNGVTLPQPSMKTCYLTEIGVEPRRYILAVARFVPEKGLHDLIKGFKSMDNPCKLVIAGDADHETDYSKKLRRLAEEDRRVVLTGYITGEPLHQLYSNAGIFVLPSYHEGLPIALLEAMSYGLPALVSDIPANKEVGLANDQYFRCGDVTELSEKMEMHLSKEMTAGERDALRTEIAEKYDWDKIAEQTIEVYHKVTEKKFSSRDKKKPLRSA